MTKTTELWELVKLVSERYGQRLQAHRSAKGAGSELSALTVQQFQYLQAVGALPGPTVGSLASYFEVTSPTATSIVNRLEGAGYVEKRPSGRDNRVRFVVLTARGRKVLRAQEDAFRALAEEIRGALTASELAAYQELTAKVCAKLPQLE
ncbi:MAG: MarR family transcriptional regulator [Deltaproteobacteria bacterium]|nr:MarR family transcriptional regulator [Deltaproteobacteria bacterium]